MGEEYKTNKDKIFTGYLSAKHQLYEKRSKAQFTAKVFSNGTDPVASAVRELITILARYEDEILEDNQEMHDEFAQNMRNVTETVKTSFESVDQQLHETNDLMMQLNDTGNSLHAQSTRGHYHCGLASTFGTMFGMLITFLLLIVFKKIKHRNDPVKYTLF